MHLFLQLVALGDTVCEGVRDGREISQSGSRNPSKCNKTASDRLPGIKHLWRQYIMHTLQDTETSLPATEVTVITACIMDCTIKRRENVYIVRLGLVTRYLYGHHCQMDVLDIS